MYVYVGNLSREFTEAELQQQFEAFCQVISVNSVKDKRSGVSKWDLALLRQAKINPGAKGDLRQ